MDLVEALGVTPEAPKVKSKRGRPRKTAGPTKAEISDAPVVALPTEVVGHLLSLIDRYQARLDAEPTDMRSHEALKEILREHGQSLKNHLRPENQLHPDISAYNPLGERDHKRPGLKRPCFFMGVPLEQPTLTWGEIDVLNKFSHSLECDSPSGAGKWRAVLLRDSAGSEVLYFSVPFRSWDDLRGIGSLSSVASFIYAGGKRMGSADDLQAQNVELLERLRVLEEMVFKTAAVPPAASSEPASL
jgi:hypothetical protein